MKKLLNNPWLVTALVLTAVAFVGASLRPKHVVAAAAVAPEPTRVVAAELAAGAQSSGDATSKSVEESLKELAPTAVPHDPFAGRPKAAVAGLTADHMAVPDSVDTVKVSAIWTQQGQTYVLINGQIHQAGDEISKIKIESATQEGVWVTHWKGRDFLALGVDFTLITPAGTPKSVAAL